jgi:hypothetical protein
MRTILLAAIAMMLMSCTTPDMRTAAANTGQQASEAGLSRDEAPPPRQLSSPTRRGWAANYRSTPR